MIDRSKRITSLVLTLALIAGNLVAFNALLAHWQGARADLTEDGLYSITPATRRLLDSLDEDVLIHGYFSRRTHPKLAPLVPQVADLLEEYAALSGGRVKVEIVDPREDEQIEQEASSRFGVQSTPFRLASKYEAGIVNAFFALVIQHADQYVRYGFDDLIHIEPLPDGDVDVRLRNLEYDLTRGIKKVVFGFRSSAELFERVEGPVRFTAVMTADALPEMLQEIPQAVRDAAAQLAEAGGERFEFEEIDPTGDEALMNELYQRFGARPMTLGLFDDSEFYLYGFLQTGNRLEQLDLVSEETTAATVREAIEDSLRRQSPGFLKTVGVVTPDPSIPPEILMQMQMQGRAPQMPPPEFQQIKLYLERDYRVSDVSLGSPVPTDVDVLLVLRPRDLDEQALFNLDQYLMRGGRVIVANSNFQADFGAQGLSVTPIDSGLGDWLAHYGVSVPETLVLDERNQPFPVPEIRRTVLGNIRTWRMEPYPYLVEVRDDGLLNREVAGSLRAMGLYWTSPVEIDDEALGDRLEAIPLLQSSADSWTDPDVSQVAFVDHVPPEEGTEPRLLAAALTGRFSSYFADRQPPSAATGGAGDDQAADAPPADVVLKESPDTRLVVIGNGEFLSDFVSRALGTQEGGFFVENLAFVQNLIDWVNLDSDMISIRSRGAAARRLEPVDSSREMTLEAVNYLVPLIALLALAGWRIWRRNNTLPVLDGSGSRAGGTPQEAQR